MKTQYTSLLRRCFFTAALLTCSILSADKTETNHTFFAPRPHGMNLAMEQPTWCRRANNDTTFGGALQVSGFYTRSSNGSDLAKYFMFDDKDKLNVSGAPAAGDHVDSVHFGIQNQYRGTVKLDPEHESYGARLDYHHDLDSLFQGLYFTVSAPIVKVVHNPNLTEKVTTRGDADHHGPTTMAEALKGNRLSSAWTGKFEYGKVDGAQELAGLADIDVRFGYNFFENKNMAAGVQLGVTMPTTNAPTARYLFEPTLGNRGHWAVGAGAHLDLNMWTNPKVANSGVSLAVHANYRYMFKDTEKRTLELKGKKWGRYLAMRQINPRDNNRVLANAVPGVNVLTRDVDVTPGSHVEGLVNVSYQHERWNFNAGYNVWWREQESVKLAHKWDKPGKFGIASTHGQFAGGEFLGHRNPNVDGAIARTALEVFKMGFDDGPIGGVNAVHGGYDQAALFLGPKLGFTRDGIANATNAITTAAHARAAIAVAFANANAVNASTNALLAMEATNGGDFVGIPQAAVPNLGGGGGIAVGPAPGPNLGTPMVGAGIVHGGHVTDPANGLDGLTARVFTPARDVANDFRLPNTNLAVGDHGFDLAIGNVLPALVLPADRADAVNNRSTIAAPAAGGAGGVTDAALTEKDVDWERVQHPSSLSHKLFASVAYDLDFDHPTYVGVGGSYEFGDNRKALDQWSIWAKLGVSF